MLQAIVKGKLVGAVRSNPAGNAVHATVEVLEGPSESMTGKKLTLVSFARYYPDAVEYLRSLAPGDEVDVAGKLETNDYGGVARLQLVVRERGNTTSDRGEWVSPEDVAVRRDETHAWRHWWNTRPESCPWYCFKPHTEEEGCIPTQKDARELWTTSYRLESCEAFCMSPHGPGESCCI